MTASKAAESAAPTPEALEVPTDTESAPGVPRQFHWKPDTIAKIDNLEGGLRDRAWAALHDGPREWAEYKRHEEWGKIHKRKFNSCMQEVLPFLDGKAEAEEGSFTVQWGKPRETVDIEGLKQWLVAKGVDAMLLANGIAANTKVGKTPEPYVKFNPSRKKKGD